MNSKQCLEIILEKLYLILPKNIREDLVKPIKQDLDELDQYKQLKEELGIDFITFFKAMKNGIYCIVEDENNNKVIDKFRATQLCYNPETKLFYWYGSIIGYPDLIDYGKTWALTREELQDDK